MMDDVKHQEPLSADGLVAFIDWLEAHGMNVTVTGIYLGGTVLEESGSVVWEPK